MLEAPGANGKSLPVLEVLQPSDLPAGGLALQADVAVIGSGAGGAVAAYQLARSGAKVVVLEAGPYRPSSQFTEHLASALLDLYEDGGNQTNKTGDMVVLQGKCVGGSTVVNAAVCFRAPDPVLRSWGRDFGLDSLSPEAMTPYFERVERHLGVHENGPHEVNLNGRLLMDGASKVGVANGPVRRNIKDCALTGHCLSGCRTDRKQSMLVTYLPWTSELGAKIFSGARAEAFEVNNRRVTQVTAIAEGVDGSEKRIRVKADLVVVAAGAVQTPLLFQKNAIGNGSGLIGRNFACHPSTLVFGEYPEDVDAWTGATISAYAGDIEDPLSGGYLLEGGMVGPVLTSTAVDGGVGAEFTKFMMNNRKFLSAVTLIHDQNVGRVHWDGGRKRIDYDLTDGDFKALQGAFRAAAQIWFAAGARRVFLPTLKRVVIEKRSEIDSVINGLRNEKQRYRLTSYHPQGTMRMGSKPETSVVAPDGRCHELDNVYVADASLFPTTLLVNPQLTVYALSSYVSDRILARG